MRRKLWDGSDVTIRRAKIGDKFVLSLAKNSHWSFPPSHFPSLPSRRGHQRRKWRHHCRAKIGDIFALSLAKNSHLSFPPSHFPSLPSRRGHLYETSKSSIKLRRFAAVSPFCFGYPAQPDIASWRIRIIQNHFDRPTLFFATRRQGRYPRSLEAFFFTPVDFLSVSRHDARAPLERTKDVDFRRVQLSTEWCLKARNGTSTSRRVGAWSIFRTFPELFSAVVSVIFPFCAGGPGEWAVVRLLRRRWTPAQDSCWSRQRRRDSSMSIWWVYSQSASQHFFGSDVLQSSFSLSCTYALGEWSVVSHRWSRRTPAGFCIWSNQRGYFTEGGRKNWTFTKSELLLHRHEATAPALAKQKLYAISMHCLWRT